MRFALVLVFLTSSLHAAEPVVRHDPTQPLPGTPVLVTAKLGVGVKDAKLLVQTVAPGKYIRKSDADYEKFWTELPMLDDGQNGDKQAGDGVFSIRVPEKYQQHRWLLRYRVKATDANGKPVLWPAKDDTCPNFAWWCDAGPSEWKGSREPGKPITTFSTEFQKTLQSLHLIARAEDVAKSQWDGNFHKQKQPGTLVYRGIVYDHIQFSNRGQGSAHISGKNKWGLKFNHGHDVPFVDHDGRAMPPIDSLNLNPGGSTPYLPVLRGIGGLDEVMSMRAYRLAGVPSPFATWVQWRVVTTVEEVSAKDQYTGDLWGLYVAVGDMEPKLLADRKLPDGLAVSMQSGIKHTPNDLPEAQKVWETFINGVRSGKDEAWWRKNLDITAYASFHAMNRLIGNVDLRPDGNHGYYRNPDGHWSPIPWDNDMTFVPRHHQPGYIDAINCLRHPAIAIEFRNRSREILDLFASDNTERGGQVGQLVADLGSALAPKNFPIDWAKLDEAKWNHHPRMNQKGSYFVNPAQGEHFGGAWKRTLATNDFAGFRKYLVDFCTDSRPTKNYAPNDGDHRGYGWGYLQHEAKDEKIPARPTVRKTANRCEATEFRSAVGHQPAALEWRIGRIGQRGWYELNDWWRTEKATGRDVELPTEKLKEPGEYRVRARWRDQTGRCSHWSEPVLIRTAGS